MQSFEYASQNSDLEIIIKKIEKLFSLILEQVLIICK